MSREALGRKKKEIIRLHFLLLSDRVALESNLLEGSGVVGICEESISERF